VKPTNKNEIIAVRATAVRIGETPLLRGRETRYFVVAKRLYFVVAKSRYFVVAKRRYCVVRCHRSARMRSNSKILKCPQITQIQKICVPIEAVMRHCRCEKSQD
jgi:hypothetical protein